MKILVFEVNWLGDVVLSTPVFKTIKENFPSSSVAVALHPRTRPLLEYNPYIDKIIEFDERGLQRPFRKKIEFVKFIRREKFDKVILLHRSFTRALLCLLAGIPERIGYSTPKRRLILAKPISPPPGLIHRQDYYLYLLKRAGFKITERVSHIYVRDEHRRYAQDILQGLERKVLIGMHCSGNWPLKRWPYFAELLNLFKDFDWGIVLVGSSKEEALINSLLSKVNDSVRRRIINLAGKTSLLELAAVCERLDCFVSSDSGPLHIASSIGTKTVGIFGPTHPEITSPRGPASSKILFKDVGCSIPCYVKACPWDLKCLRSINPEEVLKAIREIIEE